MHGSDLSCTKHSMLHVLGVAAGIKHAEKTELQGRGDARCLWLVSSRLGSEQQRADPTVEGLQQ